MSSLISAPAAARAFEHLIDYAGLFPPAGLALAQALEAYDTAAGGAQSWMLGRFIIPASRLGKLRSLRAGKPRLDVSVILDIGADAYSWFGAAQDAYARLGRDRENAEWTIAAIDVPLPRLLRARDTFDGLIGQCAALHSRAGFAGVPAYLEFPAGEQAERLRSASLSALARYGLRAKLRCGGVDPAAYPSVAAVAGFVVEAQRSGVPFKATAGLHHPVRHASVQAGVTMHGFLNLLCAAAFAPHVEPEIVEAIVAEEDPAAFGAGECLRWREREAGEREVARARRDAFVGYGSCGFDQPVDDLRALALLPEA
ncbi:MAG TPA: hypothetical protein VIK27_08340 [Candidatus Aquilonibacter sp.]